MRCVVEGKSCRRASERRKNENEVKRNVNVNECVAADGCCFYYCECGVLEKYWYFSDFIIVRMLFIFRKTYNKNTFLLRWFIAFICLNGRYFGDYTHIDVLPQLWHDEKNQNRFLFRYFSHSFLEHHSSFMTIVNAIKYYDDDVNEKEEVVTTFLSLSSSSVLLLF